MSIFHTLKRKLRSRRRLQDDVLQELASKNDRSAKLNAELKSHCTKAEKQLFELKGINR